MSAEQEMTQGLRELAGSLITAADEYYSMLDQLAKPDPQGFVDARRRAYSLAITCAQLSCATLELVPTIRELAPELRPPLPLLVALGSLGGAFTLIAAADRPEKLHDVALPTAQRLQELITAPACDGWLRRILSQPAA